MSSADDNRARFLAGMSHAAQTVNIVTTDGPAGRAGVTVSAMTSVSAETERPTLLVCVHRDSAAAPAILENRIFCVNMLRDDQTHISDIFAGRHRNRIADKFDHAEWTPMPSGAPRVLEPLVAFDCRLVSADLVGTHHVFFGEVDDVFIADDGSPLIYARRSYRAAAPIAAMADTSHESAPHGRLVLACTGQPGVRTTARLLHHLRDRAPDLTVHMMEGDSALARASLLARKADLALICDESPTAGLACEPLADLTSCALLPAGDPLAARTALAPRDFADRPLILHTAMPDRVLGLLRAQGIEPRIAGSADSVETVHAMVAEGLGIAVLTGPLPSDGKAVLCRPLGWAVPPARLMLIRRRGPLSPDAARLVSLCHELKWLWES